MSTIPAPLSVLLLPVAVAKHQGGQLRKEYFIGLMKSSNHANLSSFTENLKVVRSYYLVLHWNTAFCCVHLPKTISSYFKTSFLWLNYCIYLVHGRFFTAPFHIPFGFAFSSCLSPCICVSKFNCCMTPMIRIKLIDSVMFHFWVRLVMLHIFILICLQISKKITGPDCWKGKTSTWLSSWWWTWKCSSGNHDSSQQGRTRYWKGGRDY